MKLIYPIFILFIFSSCFSPSLGAHVVTGKVLDSESLEPIRNVEVKLKITKPFLEEEARTNSEGDFKIEYSGDLVLLPDLFLEEGDLRTAERKIKVNLIHSEFVSDYYEEVRECKPEELAEFDVGAFYLQRKEEFAQKKVAFSE